MRVRAALTGGAAVLLLVAGCATPAWNSGAYVENGKGALDSAISATASAQLVVQQRLAGDAPRPYADVVVTDGESAIAPIESSFGGVDPPSPSDDPLRDAVLQAVGAAGDALSQARIAVRRDDHDALQQAADDLRAAQQQLQSLRESLP